MKDNPTDTSIISEYAKLSEEVSEWSSKASEIQSKITSDDIQEYIDAINRVNDKLTNALK